MNTARPSSCLTDTDLRDHIRSAVLRAVEHVAGVPGHDYSVDEIRTEQRVSPLSGTAERVVTIRLTTNDRAFLLGQYIGTRLGGLRGYNCSYLYGWIYGDLEARYGAAAIAGCRFALDVQPLGGEGVRPYRYVGLDDAVAEGVLRPEGDIYQAMRENGVRFVLMAGPVLGGPSLAMMTAVEDIVGEGQPTTVLDAFSGSGALARVALNAGARRVISVDIGLDDDVYAANIGKLIARTQAVRADVHCYQPDEPVDMVICDPFYEFAEEAIETVAPLVRSSGGPLIMNLGPIESTYWRTRLHRHLAEEQMRVDMREFAGEVVGVCEG
jgi:hypothetical protein